MKEHMEEHMKPKPWLITKMMLFYRTAAPLDYFILTFQKASPKSWLRSSKGSGGSCFATDLMNHEPITYASMLLSIKLNLFPNSSNKNYNVFPLPGQKCIFFLPMMQVGSFLGEMYSASCTQVISLSPEVRVNPSTQSTKTFSPWSTGNTESVTRCPPLGNSEQVPMRVDVK